MARNEKLTPLQHIDLSGETGWSMVPGWMVSYVSPFSGAILSNAA